MGVGYIATLKNGNLASTGIVRVGNEYQTEGEYYYMKIWNPNTGNLVASVFNECFLYILKVIQNGNYFITTDDCGKFMIWDNDGGVRTLAVSFSRIIAELNNGDLASFNNDFIDIFSVNEGRIKNIITFYNQVYSVTSLQNGNIALGCNQNIIIMNNDLNYQVTSFSTHSPYTVDLLATLKDGNLASCNGYYENVIKIWNPDNGFLLTTLTGGTSISAISSLNNGYLAGLDDRNGVRIWNTDDGTLIKTLADDYYGPFVELENGYIAKIRSNSIEIWNLFLD